MKKIIMVWALLLILLPSVSDAESFKITSPAKGDTYYYSENLDVKWTPKNKGVKTIEIKSKNTKDGLTIYAQKVYGYPTNYRGYFDYLLPETISNLRPGEYYLKIVLEDDQEYKSGVFTITSEDETIFENVKQTDNAKYSLGDFVDIKKKYETTEPIEFSVTGLEKKNTIASPEDGFHIQAHIFKKGTRNSAIEAINAEYDYDADQWTLSFKNITKPGNYDIVVTLYCGQVGIDSYCANKYGSNHQVEKIQKIKVVKAKKTKTPVVSTDEHYIGGNSNSKIKVITYTDFECPFCKGFHSTVKKLSSEYKDKVAFIYRHYPLTQIHRGAESAANATECAAKLGGESKFTQYMDSLFEISPDLDSQNLVDIAGDIGINEKTFGSCLKSKKYSKEVQKDIDAGNNFAKKDGMFGTPYSIIYGPNNKETVIRGNQPYLDVKEILDGLLKQ